MLHFDNHMSHIMVVADPFSRKTKWRPCVKERLSFLNREEALFKIGYGGVGLFVTNAK